jgi:magnesium transporter
VGLITVDDIVDVVIEEATEDLYKLSGTSDYDEQKLLEGHIGYAIKSRLPWLIITIFGGLIGSHIITKYASVFSSHHFTLALSLSFAPLLVGLGGNIGNQSATIIVRGLSTGYVRIDKPFRYILRETAIGFTIGLILSIFLYIVTLYFVGNPLLTKIVSISLLINLTTASLIGSSLPIILKKLSIDPAVASAPFLSTSIDIIGQLIYFALTLYVIAKLAL